VHLLLIILASHWGKKSYKAPSSAVVGQKVVKAIAMDDDWYGHFTFSFPVSSQQLTVNKKLHYV